MAEEWHTNPFRWLRRVTEHSETLIGNAWACAHPRGQVGGGMAATAAGASPLLQSTTDQVGEHALQRGKPARSDLCRFIAVVVLA